MTQVESHDGGDLMIIDRRTGQLVVEPVLGDRMLRLAYTSRWRPILRATLFRSGLASALLGRYSDTSWSKRRIGPAIDALGIDEADFLDPVESYRTFNEFFTRKLRDGARPFDPDPKVLVSPADARLTVIPHMEATTAVPVKGAAFSLEALLRLSAEDLELFSGGPVLVFRLCPADYHRYHFPAAGKTLTSRDISGRYDSVNPLPLALGLPIFSENHRVVTMIDFENFGRAAFVEVGAFGVSGIVDTHGGGEFEKMAEKGYFRFGASTLILVLQPNTLLLDPDLVGFSSAGHECLVRAGERLGFLQRSKEGLSDGD